MKKIYPLLLFLFCVSFSEAQKIRVVNDTAYRPPYAYAYSYIDSAYKLEKDNSFEFIFTANVNRAGDVFILSQKKGKWKARFFEQYLDSLYKLRIREVTISNDSIKQLWTDLRKGHLLTLPNADTFKDSTGEMLYPTVIHGTHYAFYLHSKTGKRSYRYHCPALCVEEFPWVKEYGQVLALIKRIYRFCAVKRRVC